MYDHFDDANHLTCDHSMPDEDYFDLAITILHQSCPAENRNYNARLFFVETLMLKTFNVLCFT